MAANMGDISLDNGYTEALIIFNGRTIEGVGGGVCQVSTTLFRTAFSRASRLMKDIRMPTVFLIMKRPPPINGILTWPGWMRLFLCRLWT